MSIVLARVDNRLIHGQVLEAWIPSTGANCIVVANNEVADGDIRKRLMAAAVPRGIRVVIESIEESTRFVLSPAHQALKILLLFASPEDALCAYGLGVHFHHLNLGNLHRPLGEHQVGCTITLDQDDILSLAQLEEQGVEINLQCVPSERQRGWRSMLKVR